MTVLQLAPRGDLGDLAAQLQARGRVRVPALLETDGLALLQQRLSGWTEWALVTRLEGRHRSFDSAGMDRLDTARRGAFDALVQDGARTGFQYLFERYPLVDQGRAGKLADPVLQQAFALVRSEAFLELGRQLFGDPSIRFADGQLTRYRAGHFLTLHDDASEGLNRVGAYVINLSTTDWQAAWGGLLGFGAAEGRHEEQFLPQTNTLSLFRVPAPHWVSRVAAEAPGPRLAITGWFRHGDEPPLGTVFD